MFIDEITLENLQKIPCTSVFSSFEWLNIYDKKKLTLLGIFDSNKKLKGYFFHYNQKQLTIFNHITLPPFSPHNGLIIHDDTQNKANKLSFQKKLMALIADYYNKSNASIITLAFPQEFTDMQTFTWKKFKVIPFYTYNIDLKKSESELNNNISPKTRNLIKKAIKDELVAEITNDFSIIEQIVIKSMERNRVEIDNNLLKRILFFYANKSNSFSFVIKANRIPIAATFCVFDNTKCYYLLGGYDENNAHSGAGPLAVWCSILEAKKLNLSIFDFEGSMIEPIESYFRSFGGDLIPYFTINKGTILTETLLKFKKRGQF